LICRALDKYRSIHEKFGTEMPVGRTEEWLDCLVEHSTESLAWALDMARKRYTSFPTIAHIEGLIQEYRADHRAETRKNANCPRCEGTGFVFRGVVKVVHGVEMQVDVAHPCQCRPAPPPEFTKISQGEGGGPAELAGKIAEAARGRMM